MKPAIEFSQSKPTNQQKEERLNALYHLIEKACISNDMTHIESFIEKLIEIRRELPHSEQGFSDFIGFIFNILIKTRWERAHKDQFVSRLFEAIPEFIIESRDDLLKKSQFDRVDLPLGNYFDYFLENGYINTAKLISDFLHLEKLALYGDVYNQILSKQVRVLIDEGNLKELIGLNLKTPELFQKNQVLLQDEACQLKNVSCFAIYALHRQQYVIFKYILRFERILPYEEWRSYLLLSLCPWMRVSSVNENETAEKYAECFKEILKTSDLKAKLIEGERVYFESNPQEDSQISIASKLNFKELLLLLRENGFSNQGVNRLTPIDLLIDAYSNDFSTEQALLLHWQKEWPQLSTRFFKQGDFWGMILSYCVVVSQYELMSFVLDKLEQTMVVCSDKSLRAMLKLFTNGLLANSRGQKIEKTVLNRFIAFINSQPNGLRYSVMSLMMMIESRRADYIDVFFNYPVLINERINDVSPWEMCLYMSHMESQKENEVDRFLLLMKLVSKENVFQVQMTRWLIDLRQRKLGINLKLLESKMSPELSLSIFHEYPRELSFRQRRALWLEKALLEQFSELQSDFRRFYFYVLTHQFLSMYQADDFSALFSRLSQVDRLLEHMDTIIRLSGNFVLNDSFRKLKLSLGWIRDRFCVQPAVSVSEQVIPESLSFNRSILEDKKAAGTLPLQIRFIFDAETRLISSFYDAPACSHEKEIKQYIDSLTDVSEEESKAHLLGVRLAAALISLPFIHDAYEQLLALLETKKIDFNKPFLFFGVTASLCQRAQISRDPDVLVLFEMLSHTPLAGQHSNLGIERYLRRGENYNLITALYSAPHLLNSSCSMLFDHQPARVNLTPFRYLISQRDERITNILFLFDSIILSPSDLFALLLIDFDRPISGVVSNEFIDNIFSLLNKKGHVTELLSQISSQDFARLLKIAKALGYDAIEKRLRESKIEEVQLDVPSFIDVQLCLLQYINNKINKETCIAQLRALLEDLKLDNEQLFLIARFFLSLAEHQWIDSLLEKGFDLNYVSSSGESLLSAFSEQYCFEVTEESGIQKTIAGIRYFIEKGYSFTQVIEQSEAWKIFIASHPNIDCQIATSLLHGVDQDKTDAYGLTILNYLLSRVLSEENSESKRSSFVEVVLKEEFLLTRDASTLMKCISYLSPIHPEWESLVQLNLARLFKGKEDERNRVEGQLRNNRLAKLLRADLESSEKDYFDFFKKAVKPGDFSLNNLGLDYCQMLISVIAEGRTHGGGEDFSAFEPLSLDRLSVLTQLGFSFSPHLPHFIDAAFDSNCTLSYLSLLKELGADLRSFRFSDGFSILTKLLSQELAESLSAYIDSCGDEKYEADARGKLPFDIALSNQDWTILPILCPIQQEDLLEKLLKLAKKKLNDQEYKDLQRRLRSVVDKSPLPISFKSSLLIGHQKLATRLYQKGQDQKLLLLLQMAISDPSNAFLKQLLGQTQIAYVDEAVLRKVKPHPKLAVILDGLYSPPLPPAVRPAFAAEIPEPESLPCPLIEPAIQSLSTAIGPRRVSSLPVLLEELPCLPYPFEPMPDWIPEPTEEVATLVTEDTSLSPFSSDAALLTAQTSRWSPEAFDAVLKSGDHKKLGFIYVFSSEETFKTPKAREWFFSLRDCFSQTCTSDVIFNYESILLSRARDFILAEDAYGRALDFVLVALGNLKGLICLNEHGLLQVDRTWPPPESPYFASGTQVHTPLSLAIDNENWEIVLYLLQHVSLTSSTLAFASSCWTQKKAKGFDHSSGLSREVFALIDKQLGQVNAPVYVPVPVPVPVFVPLVRVVPTYVPVMPAQTRVGFFSPMPQMAYHRPLPLNLGVAIGSPSER